VVAAAGIDTWSPAWKLAEGTAIRRAVAAEAVRPTARGRMLPDLVDGHRVVWFESAGLLAAEGHPEGDGVLASPDRLPEALARLSERLSDRLGAELPGAKRFEYSDHGFEGVRRLDATVNIAPGSAARGLAVLAGVAAARPAGRIAPIVRREPGGRAIETITWAGTRGIVARVYDKGVESNSAPRGELIRLEDQRRWPSGHRRDVSELTGAYVCEKFRERFVPLWRASKGLRVVAMQDVAEKLAELVRGEEITPLQAKRVAAHLLFESAGIHLGSRTTRYRDRQLAEGIGLVVADGVLENVEVNLAEVLEPVLDVNTWQGTD
jgi:hypothetical protein